VATGDEYCLIRNAKASKSTGVVKGDTCTVASDQLWRTTVYRVAEDESTI